MKAYLVFGCNGYADSFNYIFCKSISNPIVDLSKLGEKRDAVMDFMDDACGLFDAPCYDYNKCINIINLLFRQFGIIDQDRLYQIQSFVKMHKMCGIYLMLVLKEDYNE